MKTIRYIFVLATLLFFSSCSDYFSLTRPAQVAWQNLPAFDYAAIGAYASLFSGDVWNMPFVNDRFIKSDMGDDVGFADEPDKGYPRAYSKPQNQWTQNTFVSAYRAIGAVNTALDFVKAKGENTFSGVSPSDKINNYDRIIGELHFVRAYAYYILQTTFGHTIIPGGDNSSIDIPIPTSYPKSAQEARNPKIGTTQEVYDLITSDLRIAKSLLPEKYDATLHPAAYAVRANRFAASGMLVRAYLQKGSYDSARMECDYLIDGNGGQYDLSEDPIKAFNKTTLANGKEVIFYAPFYDATLPVPNHLSVINDTWAGELCGWVQAFMDFSTVQRLQFMTNPKTDTTISIVAKRDKRFTQLMAVRYPTNKHLPTQETDFIRARKNMVDYTCFICNKYYRGAKGITGMNTNVPLIRLAEIYLTRSRLRLKNGDAAGAAADLNVVRKRAWDITVDPSYTDVTAVEITPSMIDDQRIIELFNEGDRITYLRGIKDVQIPVGDHNNPGGAPDPSFDSYTSDGYIWPMPTYELTFNDQFSVK